MNGSRALFAIAVMVLGVALGLGSYTFAYARGWAYMTDDPRACANCHVMNEQYDGWIKSSHRSVAVCNDCHVPHSFVAKYVTKATNGAKHSYHFTRGEFPEPIRALPASRAIAEANCRRCHEPVVAAMGTPAHAGSRDVSCIRCHEPVVQTMGTPAHAGSRDVSCIRCHGSVGHLELPATNVPDSPR